MAFNNEIVVAELQRSISVLSRVIPILSNSLTIKDEWTIKLHDANYLVEKSVEELEKKVYENVRQY